jgi:hypothetical protein
MRAQVKALQADSYRPSHDSQSQHDDNWRPWHSSESQIHDTYCLSSTSMSQTQRDSYRPGHDFPHRRQGNRYRPGNDSNSQTHQTHGDSYRQHDLDNQSQGDSYRPSYNSTMQATSPVSTDSAMVSAPSIDSTMVAPGEPVPPPPPSPAATAMDVDMDLLLLTAGNLTIDREGSPKSVVALTRELIVRGLPLELANLYASDNVQMIPLHKVTKSRQVSYKAKCKTCWKLQVLDSRKKNRQHPHICSPKTVRAFERLLEVGGWHEAFKEVDSREYKLGPGPHDEIDSTKYLGKKLVEATQLAGRDVEDLRASNRSTMNADDSSPALPYQPRSKRAKDTPHLPKPPAKAKAKPTRALANDDKAPLVAKKTRNQRKKERRVQVQQAARNSVHEDVAQAQARAVTPVPAKRQNETAQTAASTKITMQRHIEPQQALPAFDINDLEKQIDSLSLSCLRQEATGDGLVKEKV